MLNSIYYELYTFPYDSRHDSYKPRINIDVSKSEPYSLLYSKVFGSKRKYSNYEYNLFTRLVRDPNNKTLHK
jgi:hypothetical protein